MEEFGLIIPSQSSKSFNACHREGGSGSGDLTNGSENTYN